jgi:hypothetical protein
MKVSLIGSSNGFVDVSLEKIASYFYDSLEKENIINDMQKFSQNCARVCYTMKDFSDLILEQPSKNLLDRLINSGHHSVFEHINFNFNLHRIPKALAMVLNNEKQYATSEKSARYTKMKDIEPHQKKLYDKWDSIFLDSIAEKYPESELPKMYVKGSDGKRPIDKLAQENARYMTSVFTPTKMVQTINWRQLNFLANRFQGFIEGSEARDCSEEYANKLIPSMNEFNEQTSGLIVSGMDNQTDRDLSLFKPVEIKEYFGPDIYSTKYNLSFAGLAQAQRHRTLNYNILDNVEKANFGYFVPALLKGKPDLVKEWHRDLSSVSEYGFPQAQLLQVAERGMIEDFRSKTILRDCGQAQHEIMENTLETAGKYKAFQKKYGENSLKPKCQQEMNCASPCVWGGKKALERII